MTAQSASARVDTTSGPGTSTQLDEIPEVVQKAREAQRGWEGTPLYERVTALLGYKRRVLARAETLSRTIAEDTGKPLEEALLAEVLAIADLVDYWTEAIEGLLEPSQIELDPLVFPGKGGRVERLPRGVVALVTPWNYPLVIPMRHLVPALLCGNAVVWKPSEVTPRVAREAVSLLDGLVPSGLVSVVEGDRGAGERLIDSGVDAVSFTGGVESGKRVAARCAGHLIPCSLELGGKDAAIVLADARLERAARGVVWGAFTNAGQNCAAIERVFVEKPIADAFIRRVVELTKEAASRGEVGRITTASQRAIVERQVREARAAGAQVLCGEAADGSESVTQPMVLRVEGDDGPLMTEETFGPVLPIAVVQNESDAIERANRCRYGLTASIWTRRVAHGERLARQLRVGVVTVNNHAFTAALPMAPWSGTGDTGWGVTNGPHALEGYTRPFFVLSDRSRSSTELWWYPYGETLRKLGLAMARARGGAGWFGRIAAVLTLLLLFPKRLLGR